MAGKLRVPILVCVLAVINCGCTFRTFDPDFIRTLDLADIGISEIDRVGFPTPEVQEILETTSLPTLSVVPSISWSCGLIVIPATDVKTTKFRIVGVTESYVPISGETRALVFHVKMSPLDK